VQKETSSLPIPFICPPPPLPRCLFRPPSRVAQPLEAMQALILSALPTVQLPDSAPLVRGLYQGIFQGARTVLLLENASRHEQARSHRTHGRPGSPPCARMAWLLSHDRLVPSPLCESTVVSTRVYT